MAIKHLIHLAISIELQLLALGTTNQMKSPRFATYGPAVAATFAQIKRQWQLILHVYLINQYKFAITV